MNYHQQNISKVCGLCALAHKRLRSFIWKRNLSHFQEVQRENMESALHLPNLYCHVCKVKFLEPLASAHKPEAVDNAKAAIASHMHKFPEHTDNCYVCNQFSEGEHNPSVTAAGDNNPTVISVFTFQHHLEALEAACSLCAKIDKHNLRHYTFARSRIKAEFDHIMDQNRSTIFPTPKKELFCFTCRKGFLEPFSKCRFAEPGRCVLYHQEFNPLGGREHWPEKDHYKDPVSFLQKLKNNPPKILEDIYKNMWEERHVSGNWLPYYNSWYVFCDGVLCSN